MRKAKRDGGVVLGVLLLLAVTALPAFAEGGSSQAMMNLIVLPSDTNTPDLATLITPVASGSNAGMQNASATAAYQALTFSTLIPASNDGDPALKICVSL